MTRILYWNIQNFSIDSVNPDSQQKFLNRVEFIKNIFTNASPDIFCIVEGKDSKNELEASVGNGQLVKNSKSLQALYGLLIHIQVFRPKTEKWCLVPPLCSGTGGFREPTGVFYNSTKLAFTGPNAWGKKTVGGIDSYISVTPVATNTFADYQGPEKDFLPNRDSIVTNPTSGAFFNENQLAARCVDGYYPNASSRTPYLTSFTELNNPNGNRNLNIFTFHTSPATADQAMGNLVGVVNNPVLPNDNVNVIVGDFNVDSVKTQSNHDILNGDIYEKYTNIGYTILIDPGTNPGNWARNKRYCMTHLISPKKATPYIPLDPTTDLSPLCNYYPRYGYMGSTLPNGTASDAGAIDNIMVKYAPNLVAPNNIATNMTIINPIVGSPYNLQPPPGIPPSLIGSVAYNQDPSFAAIDPISNEAVLPLPNNLEQYGGYDEPDDPNDPNEILSLEAFQTCFKSIHDLSDHLPLIADI